MFARGPVFVVALLLPGQRSAFWLFTAFLIALGLGVLHALKLYSTRWAAGGPRPFTAARTAMPLVLGVVLVYACRYILPEQLYSWLGMLLGVIIVGLGTSMLLRLLSGILLTHDGENGYRDAAEYADISAPRTLRKISDLLPPPAALAVLLSAIALYPMAQGVLLMGTFGAGMVTVYAYRLVTPGDLKGPRATQMLPIATASFVMMLGALVAWRSFAGTSLHIHATATHGLGPLLFVIGLGLVLGMRHSTDADHVVAISTIVSRQRSIRGAAFIGSVWGIGHTITIFIVGSLIILFHVRIPPRLGLSMEFSVAVMLVVLGIANLSGAMQWVARRLTVADDVATSNSGPAGAEPNLRERAHRMVGRYGIYQFVRPLAIGLIHGLAGSAAVALLVLSTIQDPVWATFYLLVFGVGTLVGMMCMTAAIAVPLKYVGGRSIKIGEYLNFASGMASLCFGAFLVYQLGFVGGLFSGHPQWTPQ